MARIGIMSCSNCTQELNCPAVVCLADMRKRKGFFERYPKDEPLDLIGMISCTGCPTLAAPEKIMRKVRSLAEFKIDALHFSYCVTALCSFVNKYKEVIQKEYPGIELIMGTHTPPDKKEFREDIKELLCPTVVVPQTLGDLVKGKLKRPDKS